MIKKENLDLSNETRKERDPAYDIAKGLGVILISFLIDLIHTKYIECFKFPGEVFYYAFRRSFIMQGVRFYFAKH